MKLYEINEEFLKFTKPIPDKKLIKEALKNGEEIPFAKLIQIERLDIK